MVDRGRRFGANPLAVAGSVALAAITLFAFIGPLLWGYDHTFQREITGDSPPSLSHPFGTSRDGHDLMGQVMRATQQSLRVGLLAAVITTVIGAAWGAVAGLYGGWVEAVLMRAVDVILTIPLLVVVLVLAGPSGTTTWLHVGVAMGLFGWVVVARVVRGVVLALRDQDFVAAARSAGASDTRIVCRHLVPNSIDSVVVAGTLAFAGAVLLEATLSFLGFGIQPPDTSLGLLVESAQGAVFTRPWLFYFPGGLLVLMSLAVNFVGDGLRDAWGPERATPRVPRRNRHRH